MTHIKNIPHILQNGITHRSSPNTNPNFVPIGDISLIGTRNTKKVIVDNGDLNNQHSRNITLGDFIPFYFGIKMPMLFVIQQGGNFVESAVHAEEIIYLACSLIDIVNSDLEYYFSDGHATDNFTTFYDKDMIQKLPQIVDWNSVKANFWGGDDNLNVKRKKQAEFLLKNDLPPDYIVGFGCYSESAKQQLMSIGVDSEKIKIIPNAYFDM